MDGTPARSVARELADLLERVLTVVEDLDLEVERRRLLGVERDVVAAAAVVARLRLAVPDLRAARDVEQRAHVLVAEDPRRQLRAAGRGRREPRHRERRRAERID